MNATAANGVSAESIVKALQHGPVTRAYIHIEGPLQLWRLRVVRYGFVCRYCVFERGVEAGGVTFANTLDLSGSKIEGGVNFREATFAGLALFASPPATRGTTFSGRANFEVARFDDLASFESAVFLGGADFSLAQFGAGAIFSSASFSGGPAACNAGTASMRTALFERTSFSGPTDFSSACFVGQALFENARFAANADFSGSTFYRVADFYEARFGGDASFNSAGFQCAAARCGGPAGDVGHSAVFEATTVAGDIDFSSSSYTDPAEFKDVTSGGAIAFDDASPPAGTELQYLTAVGAISFAGLTIQPPLNLVSLTAGGAISFADITVSGGRFDLNALTTPSLYIAVPDVLESVSTGDQEEILEQVESSAQAQGDLGLANQALYARRSLIGERYPQWWKRALDYVFYRGIAGYFVRPFHPLIALLAFAAVMTLIYLVPFGKLRGERMQHAPLVNGGLSGKLGAAALTARKAGHGAVAYAHGYLDTLGYIGISTTPANRRLEVLAYRVLIACALVGFANSNPTLRQMLDAIH